MRQGTLYGSPSCGSLVRVYLKQSQVVFLLGLRTTITDALEYLGGARACGLAARQVDVPSSRRTEPCDSRVLWVLRDFESLMDVADVHA